MKSQHKQATKDWQVVMTEKTSELNKLSDERIKLLEKRLETEKEEMMDAMAQEIDQIEKTNKIDMQTLLEEKKKLEAEFLSSGTVTKALSGNLSAIASQARVLSKQQKEAKEMMIVDLNEMKKTLLASFSDGLINKVKTLTVELASCEAR
jgi:hypothetical protein